MAGGTTQPESGGSTDPATDFAVLVAFLKNSGSKHQLMHSPSLRRDMRSEVIKHLEGIRQQITRLEESRRELLSVKNSVADTCLLPDELLGRIFGFACPIVGDYSNDQYRRPVRLSHVCRDWREVALATSSLWRAIPVGDTKVADLFLSRLNSTISLDLYGTFYKNSSGIRILKKLIPRARSIYFQTHDNAALKVLEILSKQPANRLEYFRFGGGSQLHGNPIEGIFQNQALMLRKLELRSVGIKWAHPLLLKGNLTDLTIANQCVPSLNELLEVLRANTNLFRLNLSWLTTNRYNSKPSDVAAGRCSASTMGRIPLTHLRDLSLENVQTNLQPILAVLDTPTRIRIVQPESRAYSASLDPEQLQHLSAFRGEKVMSVHYVHASRPPESSLAHYGTISPPGEDRNRTAVDPILELQVPSQWKWCSFFSIGQVMPLPCLQELILENTLDHDDPSDTLGTARWDRVLSALPTLRIFLLSNCELRAVLLSLSKTSPQNQELTHCPLLQTFHATILGTYEKDEDTEQWSSLGSLTGEHFGCLSAFLENRRQGNPTTADATGGLQSIRIEMNSEAYFTKTTVELMGASGCLSQWPLHQVSSKDGRVSGWRWDSANASRTDSHMKMTTAMQND